MVSVESGGADRSKGAIEEQCHDRTDASNHCPDHREKMEILGVVRQKGRHLREEVAAHLCCADLTGEILVDSA